jgi:hypothetical protein
MKKLIFIVMALILTACASANALGNKSEIEQNKDKWQNAGISHYRFNVAISCFCIFSQNGKEIDPSFTELFDKYATVDRIFDEVEAGLNGGADSVVVKYDPTYGFPT